ncbi:hypothetical protein RDI58_025080 [Solanum bulbocastanum]|uniref:Uncharacterized protein n=1 Tax=Solanum bulbocastanum TaxID=147425 RepID=A0AAN8Y414_SOLBU
MWSSALCNLACYRDTTRKLVSLSWALRVDQQWLEVEVKHNKPPLPCVPEIAQDETEIESNTGSVVTPSCL